ncbi:NACHT domain-containing protein [Streptomyces sp. NPDC047315]|uniref:NACHT domain-containing protein n=1 Tax=Streptomyces sp. NPDC047315 TaxID=3155142 RepID=UPI0033E30EC8
MTRLSQHQQRRWVRLGLLVLCALVSAALGWVLLGSKEKLGAEQLVAWAGLFVALASLAVAAAQLFPPLPPPADVAQLADDLEASVRRQWEEEVTARSLRLPRVIPLSWSATSRPVAARPEETHGGTIDTPVLRLSLNGRLEGNFDQAARQLAQGYRRVPSGRLVILGEPGAGKTVLATMLTLGLLAEREPGTPVPVLLTLSDWVPVNESLNDWIERTLGTAYYGGRTDIPRLLLRGQRLLLILDGLDEMPETWRRKAVEAINGSCGDGTGVVLTCRSAEYQDVIERGSPVLRRAPVVEVAPVSVADAVAYLSDISWPAGVEWEPVYEHLRALPDSSTSVALSTPLTLTLTRTVYSNCDRDPSELLEFDSTHAVEDHLLDHVVTAAYAPAPGSGGQGNADDWRQRAKQAEAYLTYLATYLEEHRERDLVWWKMSRRLLSRLTGLALGIGVGLLVMFTMIGGMSFMDEESQSRDDPMVSIMTGLGCAVLAVIVWYATPGDSPGRLSLRRQGSLGRLGKGFASGLRLGAILVVPVCAAGVVVFMILGERTEMDFGLYVIVSAGGCGIALAISLALAVHAWLDASPEHSKEASPSGLLRQDRASSLIGALVSGTILGVVVTPLAILCWAVAYIVFSELTYGPVAPSGAAFIAETFRTNTVYSSKTAVAMTGVLPAVVFALLVLLVRAWPRFLLLRLILAVQGRLPWTFMRFLSDARDRQLLRQSAGAYQFRHIRLQERLAGRALAQDRALPAAARTDRRTIQAVAAAVLLLVGALAVRENAADDFRPGFMKTGEVVLMAYDTKPNTLITVSRRGEMAWWNTRTGHKVRGDVKVSDETIWRDGRERGFTGFDLLAEGILVREAYRRDEFSREERVRERLFRWREGKWSSPKEFRDRDFPAAIGNDRRYELHVQLTDREELIRLDTKTKERKSCVRGGGEGPADYWRISGNGARVAAVTDEDAVAVGGFEDCAKLDELWFGFDSIRSIALSADGSELAVNAGGVTRLRPLGAP